jgi:hypothetical protein
MKPSLTYMNGGIESGDTWNIRENKWLNINKNKWLYEGNSRSDFDIFWNDFWITASRDDNMSSMLFVAISCLVFAALHYLLKSPWFGVCLVIGLLTMIIFLFYSALTFFSSLKEFICYKREYNDVYQKWIKIDSERRRNYIGG